MGYRYYRVKGKVLYCCACEHCEGHADTVDEVVFASSKKNAADAILSSEEYRKGNTRPEFDAKPTITELPEDQQMRRMPALAPLLPGLY